MSKAKKDKKQTESPPKRRGMKLHRMRQTSNFAEAYASRPDLFSPPEQSALPGVGSLPEIVPDGQTPEQRMVQAGGEQAKKLMLQPQFSSLMESMVAFRRCYAVAYRELQACLEEEAKTNPIHPMTEDVIINAAMHRAAKPFSEHTLMRSFTQTVLPWMADVVDKHNEADVKADNTAKDEAEAERRRTPLPIGFSHNAEQTEPVLGRDRSLVVAGWKPAVLWLLDQIVNSVLLYKERRFTVCRLLSSSQKTEQQQLLIRVPSNLWQACCNSFNAFEAFMRGPVLQTASEPLDLLVCDDLSAAYTRGYLGRPAPANAGDAHKHVSRLAKEWGFAFVGALPFEGKDAPDLGEAEYEQLRTFTFLRSLHVTDHPDDPEKYRIVMGHQWAVFDVSKQVVDAYATTKIIKV